MSDRSDAGPDRVWRCYLRDMIEAADKVLSYTEGLDRAAFVERGLVYDATIRNLELIGEAANRLPDEVRQRRSEIPWRDIIGLRNRLAHGYFGVDDDLLWGVVENEIPVLITALRALWDETGES